MKWSAPLCLVLLVCGCSGLPRKKPPLRTMEEPLQHFEAPADEAARLGLKLGGFTGIYVADSRQDLDALAGEEPEGVRVTRVVENSPGDAAGVFVGDLIFEVGMPDGSIRELAWPSDWRAVELDAEPGSSLQLIYDRAGVEAELQVAVQQRLHAPGRHAVERFREEDRVGVVLRTATEVEARAAGLAPGAGAVVVGLDARSPLRAEGVQFGDLIAHVAEKPVAHPQLVLDAIRAADDILKLETVRKGERRSIEVSLSEREGRTRSIFIPPIYWYTDDGQETDTQILFGLVGWGGTAAAWQFRLLWFFSFEGGDADVLEEVEH